MTETQTQKYKVLIKRPDRPPEVEELDLEGKSLSEAILPAINAKTDRELQTCEYNSSIRMYYTENGTYNFGIAYQSFFGAVVFVKRKSHHRGINGKPTDITPMDVKRIKAAMGWR